MNTHYIVTGAHLHEQRLDYPKGVALWIEQDKLWKCCLNGVSGHYYCTNEQQVRAYMEGN